MIIHRIRNAEEFRAHQVRNAERLSIHMDFLKDVTSSKSEFLVKGYSYTAKKQVSFLVDYQHSDGTNVNWRERVCCPDTYFNNRMRATFHLFDIEMEAYPGSKLYITEQVTPIYTYFSEKFQNVIGSEYLGSDLSPGELNKEGIRNEDLCQLSFPDNEFDKLISLDVFEHIPEYKKGFSECARVLKPGGKMMWSVPFISSSTENSIRAEIIDGEVNHILPPEYHGDPLSDKGALCFQHFGWEMLEQMREVGFKDAYALCYHSDEFGYLGGEQFMFIAIK
jgi:hypothetical protein